MRAGAPREQVEDQLYSFQIESEAYNPYQHVESYLLNFEITFNKLADSSLIKKAKVLEEEIGIVNAEGFKL